MAAFWSGMGSHVTFRVRWSGTVQFLAKTSVKHGWTCIEVKRNQHKSWFISLYLGKYYACKILVFVILYISLIFFSVQHYWGYCYLTSSECSSELFWSPAGRHLSVCPGVRPPVCKLFKFSSSSQNYLANFYKTRHNASMDKGNSRDQGITGQLSIRDFKLTSCQRGSYLYINSPIIEYGKWKSTMVEESSIIIP